MQNEEQPQQRNKSTESRTRNYATVVYPESAPDDWISIIDGERIPTLISPCHDRDINQSADNTPKKPHYHVIVMFSSVKTKAQAKAIFDKIGGVGCEAVQSIRGYARYLCHLDNPEKAQYDQAGVIALNGADYFSNIEIATDKYKAIKEMIQWCKSNDVVSYATLFEYAMEERTDWFRVLCDSSTMVVKEYLRSYAWTRSFKQ